MRRSPPRATDFRGWSRTPAATRARNAGKSRRSAGAARGAFHRAAATRGRQDARRRVVGGPRGRRFLPLLCRARAAKLFGDGEAMPGPTGESNVLRLRGRGVFVAISPWNFPLAIFLGQVTAALMAGNAVVAKPAEQTPLIAAEAVRLLHEAGVPTFRAASGAGRRPDRSGAGRASRYRRRRLHRLDRGGALDQPHARRQGRPDRAADRGNRRHQCHDRRCHRAARTGRRRCRDLGVPLGRPALLGAAAVVRAGRRRRPHDRDDRGRRARIADRRSHATPPHMSGR